MIQGISARFVFLLWAVFGGFILHFLLSNFLTVLLRPRYEEFIDTAEDLIRQNITPFTSTQGYVHFMNMNESTNALKTLAQKTIVISTATNKSGFEDLVCKVISDGSYAQIGTQPWIPESCISTNGKRVLTNRREWRLKWHRSPKTIEGFSRYVSHITNKKWPLREVFETIRRKAPKLLLYPFACTYRVLD